MKLDYELLDVFTDRPFGGNQLAVFPVAPELPLATMQSIARELNLSETVFVRPASAAGAACRLRIFTPGAEVPFAGHPIVGCAALLSELGMVPGGGDCSLEVEAGLVPVTARREGACLYAQLTAPRLPTTGPKPPPRPAVAVMLGLSADDLDPKADPEGITSGMNFLAVPVRDVAALERIRLDSTRWHDLLAGWWASFVYAIAASGPRERRVRMFAPSAGIPEDPATGAAAVALAALLSRSPPEAPGREAWTVLQGQEIGRPSRLELELDYGSSGLQAVRLGGSVVRMGGGRLEIPDTASAR